MNPIHQGDLLLVEGEPILMGNCFAERCLDELFLTLAPLVAGREGTRGRPGFVAGKLFAPRRPAWGTPTSVKRRGGHLFLHYALGAVDRA